MAKSGYSETEPKITSMGLLEALADNNLCSPGIIIGGYDLHLYAVQLLILGYGFDYRVVLVIGSLPRSYKGKIRCRLAVNRGVLKLFNGVFEEPQPANSPADKTAASEADKILMPIFFI